MLNFSPASENNKQPILEKLYDVFTDTNDVLEIGSGSGQHAIYFAKHLPGLTWQTSELGDHIQALEKNIESYAPDNVNMPVVLDVCSHPWPITTASAIFTANTLHIMSWPVTEDLFKGVGSVLQTKGLLCIYGPFKYEGDYTTASNARFDIWLKTQNPVSGIRDFEALDALAQAQGLTLIHDYSMPANNQFLVFKRHL